MRNHRNIRNNITQIFKKYIRGGADKTLARTERKKIQRPDSGFIQHTLHEAQDTS